MPTKFAGVPPGSLHIDGISRSLCALILRRCSLPPEVHFDICISDKIATSVEARHLFS